MSAEPGGTGSADVSGSDRSAVDDGRHDRDQGRDEHTGDDGDRAEDLDQVHASRVPRGGACHIGLKTCLRVIPRSYYDRVALLLE
jgi:hypothetical protein